MLISSKKIIGLKVETKSGYKLGRIKGFDVETETMEIKKIYVRPTNIVKGLIDGDLIISKNLIISVDENRMVVDDLIGRELAGGETNKKMAPGGASLSVSTSSTNQ